MAALAEKIVPFMPLISGRKLHTTNAALLRDGSISGDNCPLLMWLFDKGTAALVEKIIH
jgi:hypothetical protein